MKANPKVVINHERLSHLLEDEGKVLGSVDITYPQIEWSSSIVTEQYVNGVYHTIAHNFYRHVMGSVYPKVLKESKAEAKGGLTIAQSSYHNTLNQNGLLSGYSEERYSNTGTGVESAYRVAVSFDLSTGKHIWLSSLFRPFSGYRKRILGLIREQIEKDTQPYKEDPLELADACLYTGNFYLTEKEIILFYQPGDLTEASDYIPSYSIPKAKLRDILR